MGYKMKIDGKIVRNARKRMKIEILPADIRSASKKKPECCAVANACMRQMPIKEIRVHLSRVFMKGKDGTWTRFLTPKNLRTEIVAFDRGGEFEPGTYLLSKPNPAKTTGKRYGTKTNDTVRRNKRKRHVTANVRPAA